MQVPAQHTTGRRGVRRVGVLVEEELTWLFREQPADSDYGIDAHLEVVDGGHATGRLIAAQIKAGDSWFREPAVGGWVFRFDDAHAEYWLTHSLPVIVVLYNEETKIAYWQAITSDSAVSTGEGYKVIVPKAQCLDGDARDVLQTFAREPRPGGDTPTARLDALLYRLPDQAANWLGVAPKALADDAQAGQEPSPPDIRPVERLAQTLVDGSIDPSATVAGLLNRPPKWLIESPVAAHLWIAIGGYAADHNAPALAAEVFLRAVDAGAQPVGRWRAFAALSMSDEDRDRARALLDQALGEDGGYLLASVGLAALEAKATGFRGPIALPAAVEEAMADPESAAVLEPTVRMFVADQYLTAGDLTAAIETLETALSQLPASTGVQLKLALALLRRVVQGLSPLRALDLQRTCTLAELARADRRRWAGPSEEAADLLLHARTVAQNLPAAVATALTEPEGEAIPREAEHQPLVMRAARIAIQIGDPRVGALEQMLTDEGAKAQLAAIRTEEAGGADEQRKAAWRRALKLASDDEQRAIAAQALARLGEVAAELQELVAVGAVAEDDAETLRTIAETFRIDRRAAIVRLRPLAATSLDAAQRLAQLLEDAGDVDDAVEVWDRVADRLGEQGARSEAIDVLGRAGRYTEMIDRTQRLLARPGLPAELHARLRRTLLHQAQRDQDWQAVEDHAEQALVEARATATGQTGRQPLPDTAVDYAWLIVMARYNRRNIRGAAAALRELQPPIRNVTEASLWLRVIHLTGWTVAEVRQAIDLASQYQDNAAFVGRAIMSLVRATALVPAGDDGGTAGPASRLTLDEQTDQQLAQLMERYHQRHPDGALRLIRADPATIPDIVRARADATKHLDRLADLVWLGALPVGMFAQIASVPYTQMLLQRGAGILPACDPDTDHYDADLTAAHNALNHKIVIEPSALAVATLLPDRWPALIAQFSSVKLPGICFDDLLAGAETIGAPTLGIDPATGQITSYTMSGEERRRLAERIASVRAAAEQLDIADVADLRRASEAMARDVPEDILAAVSPYEIGKDGAWMAPLELALTEGLAVWSDDLVLRRMLRELGVATFSTPALLHILYDNGDLPDTTEQDHAKLLEGYVVDLPRRPNLIVSQASTDGWQAGAGATALARAAWWWGDGSDADDFQKALADYIHIARAVHTAAPERLPAWFRAGARGYAALTDEPNLPAAVALLTGATLTDVTGLTAEAVKALLPAARAALADLTRIANAVAAGLQPDAPQRPQSSPVEPDLAALVRGQLHGWCSKPAAEGGQAMTEEEARMLLDDAFGEPEERSTVS